MPEETQRRWRWKKREPIPPRPGWRPIYWVVYHIAFPYVIFPALGGCEVYGQEKVPLDSGAVIAPNHVSYLDPPFVAACLPRQAYFMAKRELFEVPLLGRFLYMNQSFPVDRDGADTAALRYAADIVRQGELLFVFPEGTRSEDGTIGEGQLGAALIAGRAEAPIIPCAIVGTERILPRKAKFLRRARTYCAFGEPVWVGRDERGRLTRQTLQAATDLLMERIRQLHAEMSALRAERESRRRAKTASAQEDKKEA